MACYLPSLQQTNEYSAWIMNSGAWFSRALGQVIQTVFSGCPSVKWGRNALYIIEPWLTCEGEECSAPNRVFLSVSSCQAGLLAHWLGSLEVAARGKVAAVQCHRKVPSQRQGQEHPGGFACITRLTTMSFGIQGMVSN